jgi:two-component system OmpR family sensor kinase
LSIRRKLLLALFSALLLVGVAAGAATWVTARRAAGELFDDQLRQAALTLRDQTLGPPTALLDALDYDFIVQVWNPSGGVVYLSNSAIPLPHAAEGFQNVSLSGEPWRIYTLVRPDRVIQVAAPLGLRQQRASATALRVLVPVLAAIPLLLLLIWALVGRELRPLESIAAAIRRRMPASLEPLPERGLPQEVKPMVAELNALLGRLRAAMEAQRRFTADAAHELRSPLAALQLQVGLAERAATPQERREALDSLAAGVRRGARLVQQLLALEQVEPDAAQAAPTAVRLDELAQDVLADLEPQAEAKRVHLRLGRVEPASVLGRAPALRALVRNLVDNAIRYTPAGGEVTVSAYGQVLEVGDTGPGIPESERGRVFDRFYRVAGTTEEGSGLGLSIVKRVAEAHGAEIALGEPDHGHGLCVTVRFPPITK